MIAFSEMPEKRMGEDPFKTFEKASGNDLIAVVAESDVKANQNMAARVMAKVDHGISGIHLSVLYLVARAAALWKVLHPITKVLYPINPLGADAEADAEADTEADLFAKELRSAFGTFVRMYIDEGLYILHSGSRYGVYHVVEDEEDFGMDDIKWKYGEAPPPEVLALMRNYPGEVFLGMCSATLVRESPVLDYVIESERTRSVPMDHLAVISTRQYLIVLWLGAKAANVCFGQGGDKAEQWRKETLSAVYEEGPAAMLVLINQTRKTVRAKAKREELRKLEQYVAERAEMLDYPAFREQGFDIGSGPTEAFCKTLTARLKGSGMRWDSPNAEGMMALAALDQTSQWNAYWTLQNALAA